MSGNPWDTISDEAKDFVRSLLRGDPSQRLPISEVCKHAWLNKEVWTNDVAAQAEVLSNMKRFSNSGLFVSMCITSVARQMDHRRLKGIHKTFVDLDRNGDGYLSFEEIKHGFKKIMGEDSDEYKEISQICDGLDLDGSGKVDYTEFCAAGMGQHAAIQEEAIWAAFKTFDADNSGKISPGELKQVLENVDIKKVWSPKVCEEVAEKFLTKYDHDRDGKIDFHEWMNIMQQAWCENRPPEAHDASEVSVELEGCTSWVYQALLQVSELPNPETEEAVGA